MTLQSVMTSLSNAIQQKSGCSGPLTLAEMTEAVNSINTSSVAPGYTSAKFYRCSEYSPASDRITVTSGGVTLNDGTKISLRGTYTSSGYSEWLCSETENFNDYISASIKIVFAAQQLNMSTSYYIEIKTADTNTGIATSPINSTMDGLVYIKDVIFDAYPDNILDYAVVMEGNTSSFVPAFSGYELYNDGDSWHESEDLTTGLHPNGYTPEPGKIYSFDSKLLISSVYPAPQSYTMTFYECSNYTPEADAYTKYFFTLSGSTNEQANGTYVRTKWVEPPPEDWTDTPTAVWVNENGCKLKEYYYTEFNYQIDDSTGSNIYNANEPFWSRVTDFNTIPWVDSGWEELDHTLTFSVLQSEDVAATQESWSGYEMAFVYNDAAWLASNASDNDCNGTYVLYRDYTQLRDKIYTNGKNFLRTTLDAYGIHWAICTTPDHGSLTSELYISESFPRYSNISPVDVQWIRTVDSGNPPVFSRTSGGWQKTGILIENMSVKYLTPRVGEIYSADTSIRVRKMYDGATYPITSDGLVFYAALEENYVDKVSNTTATVTGGTFTTHNGLRCLELDGSEYAQWPDNTDLPAGDVPYSFVVMVAPTDNYDWKCYASIGYEGSDEIAIHAKNGRLEEFASANITADGKWQALALTRDASGGAKTYINGRLDGSGERTNAVPSPAHVCVGTQANSFSQIFSGCIAFVAIYNRELSAGEVAEIHATLMEDVVQ